MITKRIIPCLDVKNGRVVKGVNFQGLADVSSPVELGKYYSDNGADELVFYDITASAEGRRLFTDILTEVARTIFIPLTVGGGINTVDDFDRVLKCGADKVSEIVLNSIDTDGVKQGFDLEMLQAVCDISPVPVIASGGAGCIQDFVELFETIPTVDAGLAASIFHFGEVKISDLKAELKRNNINVR